MKNIFNKSKKIDKDYWKKIWWSKSEAKKALINLQVPDEKGKLRFIKFVDLANGSRIAVEDVTEEQAHEFMKAICPEWAFK